MNIPDALPSPPEQKKETSFQCAYTKVYNFDLGLLTPVINVDRMEQTNPYFCF